jgi:xanthine dehydrogenase large subunit
LTAFAAEHFHLPPDQVRFCNNRVELGEQSIPFAELVQLAYLARVSLSATGFFRTPKIHYDRSTFSGRPFLYFAYSAAVSEVIIDTLTGEYQVSRVDILHDVGNSLNPAIDRGQIEGGFLQGMGWLTCEELWWNADGALQTHAPSTYKIPTCRDCPSDIRVSFFEAGGNREDTVYRSKAVGEPPLMLAISVFHALKDAIASVAAARIRPRLNAPATPEAVLMAIEDVKRRAAPCHVAQSG